MKKNRKKEQERIVTAQVIGAGIFILGAVVCFVLLAQVLTSNGAVYLNEFING